MVKDIGAFIRNNRFGKESVVDASVSPKIYSYGDPTSSMFYVYDDETADGEMIDGVEHERYPRYEVEQIDGTWYPVVKVKAKAATGKAITKDEIYTPVNKGKNTNTHDAGLFVHKLTVSDSFEVDLPNDKIEKHYILSVALTPYHAFSYASDTLKILNRPENVNNALHIDTAGEIYFKGKMSVINQDFQMENYPFVFPHLTSQLTKGGVVQIGGDRGYKIKDGRVIDHNISRIEFASEIYKAPYLKRKIIKDEEGIVVSDDVKTYEIDIINVRFYIDPKFMATIPEGVKVDTKDRLIMFETLKQAHLKPGPSVIACEKYLDYLNYLEDKDNTKDRMIHVTDKWLAENECIVDDSLPLAVSSDAKADKAGLAGNGYPEGQVTEIKSHRHILSGLDNSQ